MCRNSRGCHDKKTQTPCRNGRLVSDLYVSLSRRALWSIVSKLGLALPGKKELVAPSAVVQARQRLGADAVKKVFNQSQKLWNQDANSPTWCGLSLLGVDGVIWRTPDTP